MDDPSAHSCTTAPLPALGWRESKFHSEIHLHGPDSAALPRHSSADSLSQSHSHSKGELHPDFGQGFKLGLCSHWKHFGAQHGSLLKWILEEPSQAV